MSRKTSDVTAGITGRIGQFNNLRDEAAASSRLLAYPQSTPDLTLHVTEGGIYFGGTFVEYAGGNSATFTAPTTNPRIDILSISSAGTLVRTAGTEAASPTAPTVPFGNIPICQVYNRVGQTSIKETSDGVNGYIYKDTRPFLKMPSVPTVTKLEANARIGDYTTRFDVTNPGGSTFRYTFDGTGTDPNITAITIPIGTVLDIQGQNFVAGNKGLFTVTGSGSNYFEITNPSGVTESDKTLGTGYLIKGGVYTKPNNLKYIKIRQTGGGAAGDGEASFGSAAAGGSSAGYAEKLISGADLASTIRYVAGVGGLTQYEGNDAAVPVRHGGRSIFEHSTQIITTGGQTSANPGTATGGDINITGQVGGRNHNDPDQAGTGASTLIGLGGSNTMAASLIGSDATGYGSGGGGSVSGGSGSRGQGGDGAPGIIIIEEFYFD